MSMTTAQLSKEEVERNMRDVAHAIAQQELEASTMLERRCRKAWGYRRCNGWERPEHSLKVDHHGIGLDAVDSD